jgi:hypothetical protein
MENPTKQDCQLWINELAVQQAGMLCAHTGIKDFDWIRQQVYSWWRVME